MGGSAPIARKIAVVDPEQAALQTMSNIRRTVVLECSTVRVRVDEFVCTTGIQSSVKVMKSKELKQQEG